ncbi:hypothetical protein CDG76_19025 [Nostoc sp. 'Peltigera membranacea cyanobiont' 210A]|nr:hypothetical protein CDG76_19025 [Nostoc sp. 'Peltigera membranacea cyanobiont' 210A]
MKTSLSQSLVTIFKADIILKNSSAKLECLHLCAGININILSYKCGKSEPQLGAMTFFHI